MTIPNGYFLLCSINTPLALNHRGDSLVWPPRFLHRLSFVTKGASKTLLFTHHFALGLLLLFLIAFRTTFWWLYPPFFDWFSIFLVAGSLFILFTQFFVVLTYFFWFFTCFDRFFVNFCMVWLIFLHFPTQNWRVWLLFYVFCLNFYTFDDKILIFTTFFYDFTTLFSWIDYFFFMNRPLFYSLYAIFCV